MSSTAKTPELVSPESLRGSAGLAEQFGVKAAEMCEFGWTCADHGFSVPRSWLVPAADIDPLFEAADPPAPRTYGPLPAIDDPPSGWDAPTRRFVASAESALAGLPLDRCPLVRSSVTWPQGTPRPPGIDHSVVTDTISGVGALYAGVHRAYADLCRRRSGDPPVRFGLVLTELLRPELDGTAYYSPESGLCVELGADGVDAVRADTPKALAAGGLVGPGTATGLFGRLSELIGAVPPGHFVELEFLLHNGNRFVPTQRRLLPRGPAGPAPFQSRARFAGQVLDLRGMARDVAGLTLMECENTALVIPVSDGRAVDLFALLWTLDQRPQLPTPGAVILSYGARSPAGMVTHLRWLGCASRPGMPIYYAPTGSLPPGDGQVVITSDGVRLHYDFR